jgi:hypothetical protein
MIEAVPPFHHTLWRPRHGHVFEVTIQCMGNQLTGSAIKKQPLWATALNGPSYVERHRPIAGLSVIPQQNCCFRHDSAIHSVWCASAFCRRQGQTWLVLKLFTATTTLLFASCDNWMSHFSRTAEILGQVVALFGKNTGRTLRHRADTCCEQVEIRFKNKYVPLCVYIWGTDVLAWSKLQVPAICKNLARISPSR